MDDVADVLTGMQAGYNILNTAFASGADPTGAARFHRGDPRGADRRRGPGRHHPPRHLHDLRSRSSITAGTTILGFGNGTSVIQLKASTAVTSMLTVSAVGFNYSVTISDIQLNGNKANSATATQGLYLFAGSDCIVQRVRVVNVSGNAITLDGPVTYLGTAVKVLQGASSGPAAATGCTSPSYGHRHPHRRAATSAPAPATLTTLAGIQVGPRRVDRLGQPSEGLVCATGFR